MSANIYGVVHVNDDEALAHKTIETYMEGGLDGAFLIQNQYPQRHILSDLLQRMKGEYPGFWLGVNYLDLVPYPHVAMKEAASCGADGLWTDYAMVRHASRRVDLEDTETPLPTYFGGVAFKYTRECTDDPDYAADYAVKARDAVDVITTSGPGTGYAISFDKAQAMRVAVPDKQIAIASGVSPDNIAELAALGNMSFIVGSYFEREKYDGIAQPDRVAQLTEALRG